MSFSTWTPAALSSSARRAAGVGWRLVEAQHYVSTMKLTDTAAEQARLEQLIEGSKPAVPEECRDLHYLLHTPFRYGALYPRGSRFRRAGLTPGVFYASVQAPTAVAEVAFYRLLFFAESPDTPWPSNAAEYTAFSAQYATGRAVDLTLAPFAGDAEAWEHCSDYGACQALADVARAAGIEAIRYRSVRDPDGGMNIALLACRVFTRSDPVDRQTWKLKLGSAGVIAVREAPRGYIDYGRTAFAADPRIAAMRWERP